MTTDYLWDRSGPADPDVAHLESVLSTFRHGATGRAPRPVPVVHVASVRRTRRDRSQIWAAAAMLVLGASAAWICPRLFTSWRVEPLAGTPAISSSPLAGPRGLKAGAWLTTDSVSTAQLEVPNMGRVRVDPDSRLRIAQAAGPQKLVQLSRGRIHAFIVAPPRMFLVDTPSARAVDLGCEYTLAVDPSGAGRLDVSLGYVQLERRGRVVTIPMNAACLTRPGIGPGTPFFDDATARFKEQLARFDFEDGGEGALNAVLSEARSKDALSLWHLLQSADPDLRGQVYDRLSQLKPPPEGLMRSAVLSGDRAMLDQWWDEMRPFQ